VMSVLAGAGGRVEPVDSGFELGFIDGGGAVRRAPLAACAEVRFEDGMAVRQFRWSRGQRHLPGFWWSSTTGAHVGYESWLERDHVMLLDFDQETVAIGAQPFWLWWTDARGERRRHAPDLFARRADDTAVVIDVRPDERIEPRDAEAFAATQTACRLAGWRFLRLGVLDPVLTANVTWLSRYRHPRFGVEDVAARLIGVFTGPVPLMPGAAEAGEPIAVLPVLFHLLWRHILTADLAARLTGGTVVGPGPGGSW
jgi:hypothetical protein